MGLTLNATWPPNANPRPFSRPGAHHTSTTAYQWTDRAPLTGSGSVLSQGIQPRADPVGIDLQVGADLLEPGAFEEIVGWVLPDAAQLFQFVLLEVVAARVALQILQVHDGALDDCTPELDAGVEVTEITNEFHTLRLEVRRDVVLAILASNLMNIHNSPYLGEPDFFGGGWLPPVPILSVSEAGTPYTPNRLRCRPPASIHCRRQRSFERQSPAREIASLDPRIAKVLDTQANS